MILKKLAQYGLMTVFLFGSATSMQDNTDKQLVIGCRPWDKNVEGFSGVNTADFADFMVEYTNPPSNLPSNFYQLDTDNRGMDSSGNFSDFAVDNVGKYKTIIIDWATYHHIHRDDIGADFERLLTPNGSLIIPVARVQFPPFKERVVVSKKTAEEFINNKKLSNLFGEVKILAYGDTLHDARFELLRRPNLESGRLESMLEMEPAIIVAQKGVEAGLSNFNEVKFPSLDEILDRLKNSDRVSTIWTETDSFDVQVLSLHGNRFTGFRPEVDPSKIGLQMKGIKVSPNRCHPRMKPTGGYNLSGLFHITFEESKSKMGIPLLLKSDKEATGYSVEGGGTIKTDHANGDAFYQVLDPNQIKIFRKK